MSTVTSDFTTSIIGAYNDFTTKLRRETETNWT